MNKEDRISSFLRLGEKIQALKTSDTVKLSEAARVQNGWFTDETISLAFSGIAKMLEGEKLEKWLEDYEIRS